MGYNGECWCSSEYCCRCGNFLTLKEGYGLYYISKIDGHQICLFCKEKEDEKLKGGELNG